MSSPSARGDLSSAAPAGDATIAASLTRGRAGAYVRLIRPRHWSKNVLVLAAPGAAGVLDEPGSVVKVLAAFFALCLCASGTYALNDASDAEADRHHPDKCSRPVAAGEISVTNARILGVVLLAAGLALAAAVTVDLLLVLVTYVALTVAYTYRLKHVAIVDIVAVAAGFVLRAVAGAAAVSVDISNWFLVVSTFGSLLMVTGKRIGELELADPSGHRLALARYTPEFLGQVRVIAATGTMISYSLFALERADLTDSTVPWFELTMVPFLLAILRYLWRLDAGAGGDPTDIVLSDRFLLSAGVAWAILFAAGVYA